MKNLSKIFMILSVASLAGAVVAFFFKYDTFGLAGTQWILIAILLGIYAMFASAYNCNCEIQK